MKRLAVACFVLIASAVTPYSAFPVATNPPVRENRPGERPGTSLFMSLESTAAPPASRSSGPRPSRFRSFALDFSRVRARLDLAPTARDPRAGIEIALPLPDGSLERFRVIESTIFGAGFARAHPELRTFRAIGIHERLQARIDLTVLGIRAIIFTPHGVALVDPIERGRTDRVMCYWARDDEGSSFECLAPDFAHFEPSRGARIQSAGGQIRTFRFILTACGEYTQTMGGVAAALAQMTTAMNRNQAIFERDLPVRLEVVQLHAFADPATDPFLSCDGGELLNRNRTVVDSLDGRGSYDMLQAVGIMSGYGGGAFRPLFCYLGWKGQSVVIGPDPTSNLFVLKVMPHEIGHMLGATHSQDGGSNRAAITAHEPGNGWTIMTSPGDDLSFAEPFFHAASLDQMDTTTVAPPDSCGLTSATGNTPPTADAGPDHTIPRGTPFVLTGNGADTDGDPLTYAWDEVDKAASAGDPVNGPLFRSRFPSTSPSRAFPDLATVLSGVADPLEMLPAVDRTMRFRLVVRDEHAGLGGHASDETIVTVSGAPFGVTSPNGGNSIPSGSFGVAWQVGGGSVAASVDILLSTDGGASWATLAQATPNDGSETVTFHTAVTATTCRIQVRAVDNIFYDVSNSDFTIVGDVTAVLPPGTPERLEITRLAPNPTRGTLAIEYALPASGHVRLSVLDPQGRVVAVLVDEDRRAGRSRITWRAPARAAAGLYWVRVEAAGRSAARRAVLMP